MSQSTLTSYLMGSVYKISFNLRDVLSCSKTKKRKQINRGLERIDKELDVANFIRFHLQTRGLLKQLFNSEKRRAARDLKSYVDTQSPDSDVSSNLDSYEQAAPTKN